MKVIIELDVPEYQIGEPVTVYFKDTMIKKSVCKSVKEAITVKRKISLEGVRCGSCNRLLRYDSVFCDACGKELMKVSAFRQAIKQLNDELIQE